MLKRLNSYDWKEAFKYAEPKVCEAGHQNTNPEAVITGDVSTTSFTREDVEEIIAIVGGENDVDYCGVFRLKDGRYASLRAWCCDDSGWGCEEDGDSQVAASKEDIIRFGLTKQERQRLNLLLEGETPD